MNDTREKILDVSLKLFVEHSYKEVSIQDIVDQVGMTKGAFYYFFKSKEELFIELYNFITQLFKTDYSRLSHDSLYRFYHDYLKDKKIIKEEKRYYIVNNINFNAFIYDALRNFPSLKPEINKLLLEEIKAWEEIVRIAREKGEIKSGLNNEQIALIFIYTEDGMVQQRRLHLYNDSIKNSNEKLLELWDGIYNQIKA
jgi:AcrR family transcriptional regulator